MMFTAKISATNLGNEYLTLANDGVIDSVSVGINPTKFSFDADGVMIVEAAEWTELSMVSQGAFSGAVITEVAASIPQTEPPIELNEVIPTQENTIMESVETPVEAAATVEKLWAKPAQREFAMPTPGEYLAAMHIGGDTLVNVQNAAKSAYAKQQTALQAAAGDILTTDTPGLLPVPVLGPSVSGHQLRSTSCHSIRCTRNATNTKQNIYPTNNHNAYQRCSTNRKRSSVRDDNGHCVKRGHKNYRRRTSNNHSAGHGLHRSSVNEFDFERPRW
jgi:hypothetical protein